MDNPTFEAIRIAIEFRLSSWDGAPVEYDGYQSPEYDEKRPSAPDNSNPVTQAKWEKTPWVRCVIQHGTSFTAGVGNKPCVRRTGVVSFQIFTPENKGSSPAASIADSLAAHIEYFQQGQFETLAASAQRVGDSDGWYQYNVSCPFRMG